MGLIVNIIKLTWLPFALTTVYVSIYHTYNREALSYGCHKSVFNPYILSYSLNHKDVTHITFNTIALWYFALYTIHAYGNVVTAVIYATSVTGAGAGYYIQCYLQHSDEDIIGASGGIYGLIGFTLVIAIIRLVNNSQEIHNQEISIRTGIVYIVLEMMQVVNVSVIVAFDVYIFLTSPNSTTAHSAHLGGFLCGILLGCFVVIFDLCILQA